MRRACNPCDGEKPTVCCICTERWEYGKLRNVLLFGDNKMENLGARHQREPASMDLFTPQHSACVLPVYECLCTSVPDALRDQKKVSDPRESQMAVSHSLGAGNQPRVPWKSSQCALSLTSPSSFKRPGFRYCGGLHWYSFSPQSPYAAQGP